MLITPLLALTRSSLACFRSGRISKLGEEKIGQDLQDQQDQKDGFLPDHSQSADSSSSSIRGSRRHRPTNEFPWIPATSSSVPLSHQ